MFQKENLGIIFNSQVFGVGMGGGDKIVLNISTRIKKKYSISFFSCPEGVKMVRNELGDTIVVHRLNTYASKQNSFVFTYLKRILNTSYITSNSFKNINVLWSSSDFLPDTVPGFFGKFLYKKKWYANFFLRARNPFAKEVKLSTRTLLYFFSQQISILLFRFFADKVFVLSPQDKHYLASRGIQSTILSGGVNIDAVDKVKAGTIKYDACFVGRFHYQKGLPDLLRMWSVLCKDNPKLTLSIVGSGIPEEIKSVKDKIGEYGIGNNVILHGFLDGNKKYKIIKQSKVLLFPSNFESWGVVVAEALVCGTPVISFALDQIKDNFPDGVKWVENGNIEKYQKAVKELITNDKSRKLLAKKTLLIRNRYDWKNSANTFLSP